MSVVASWLSAGLRTPHKNNQVNKVRRNEIPHSIWIKFCRVVRIPDVITCANFGEDHLRGLGVAGGQNSPFSIDFDRRPYNTLALPCERLIQRADKYAGVCLATYEMLMTKSISAWSVMLASSAPML